MRSDAETEDVRSQGQSHDLSAADQNLGGGVGHWHPHMMVFAPYYDNAMLGGNEPGAVPIVNDDAGTPFAVIVVPVDGKLAIKSQP